VDPILEAACVTARNGSEVAAWIGSFSLIGAILACILAVHRGRSGFGWFLVGGFFPILSLVVLYFFLDDLSGRGKDAPAATGPPDPSQPLAADGRWPSTSDAAIALPQDGWFYAMRRQPMGPVSLQYLRGAIEMGSLDKDVHVWCGAFRDWVTPKHVPGFFG
jgi:hypothetical protein